MGTISVDEMKADYDWKYAFHEAFGGGSPVSSVDEVLAAVSGENDGPEWVAVVKLGEPYSKYAVVAAGCDYTGWDCQASGVVEFYETADEACSCMALGNDQRDRLGEQLRQRESEGRVKLDWDDVEKANRNYPTD